VYGGRALNGYPSPRLKDGKPNLSAPAPRAANGKPDLTGVQQHERTAIRYLR
jgi:hypothetical protein